MGNKMFNTNGITDRDTDKRIVVLLLLLLSAIIIFSVGDMITLPLNNSNLQTNTNYNLTIDITAISGTTTSDTANVLVNGSLIYASTFTANGLYKIPIVFYNTGVYNITLKTTQPTLSYVIYRIPEPILSANIYLYYLNYFAFVIILMVFGFVLSYMLRHYGFFSNFVMAIASLLSTFYIWLNPITQFVNSYYIFWLGITAFLLVSIYYLIRSGFSHRD